MAPRVSESSSQLIYETVKVSHEFKIKGYSLAKGMGVGKSMKSAKFTVGGYDWVIKFYPGGYDEANQEYVSVYLELASSGKVKASYDYKLLDQSGEGIHKLTGSGGQLKPFRFKNGEEGFPMWGWLKYMKRSDLEASNYIKDDCLSIRCTVGVVQKRVEEGKHYVIDVPPPDIRFQNLKSLLESEIVFDITFHVGNEFFRAHKWVLAAQSPVFTAQFFGLMGKPDIETIVVEELEPFAFKGMLLYLYSNELPETNELSDSESLSTSTVIIQHLLAAADRYDIARLKLLCEAKLCEEITVDTVATTLTLAHQYRCSELKTVCLNFAAKPENLKEFLKSDGYAHLEKSCPSLLTDLLKTM